MISLDEKYYVIQFGYFFNNSRKLYLNLLLKHSNKLWHVGCVCGSMTWTLFYFMYLNTHCFHLYTTFHLFKRPLGTN